jgi:hypothetical protein
MIEELINKLLDRRLKQQNFTAEVLEVDKDNDTCKVQVPEGPELFGISLTAIEDTHSTKVVAYPKPGSMVMISLIGNQNSEAYVSKCSDIESFLIKTDKHQLLIAADGSQFDDGQLGGMVKAKELKTQLDKTNALVQAIADCLNQWVPTPSDGGAALKTLVSSMLPGKQVGNYTDIENPKVKH